MKQDWKLLPPHTAVALSGMTCGQSTSMDLSAMPFSGMRLATAFVATSFGAPVEVGPVTIGGLALAVRSVTAESVQNVDGYLFGTSANGALVFAGPAKSGLPGHHSPITQPMPLDSILRTPVATVLAACSITFVGSSTSHT